MKTALVLGASGGIGNAIARKLLQDHQSWRVVGTHFNTAANFAHPHMTWCPLQLNDETAIQKLMSAITRIDLIINAAGFLSNPEFSPEKSIRSFSQAQLHQSIEANTVPLLLVAKHARSALRSANNPMVVALSARVGSITDNALGGWYSYRISKAALNMAVKTLSIEWQHALPKATIIAYHPGTVQTPLSAPFERAHRNPLSPTTAAQALFDLLPQLAPKDSGSFWDWQGQSIPW